jgi:hypothetical protein
MRLIGDISILADRLWLPWLIKGLEVEDIHAPILDAADGLVPVVLCGLDAWNGVLVL